MKKEVSHEEAQAHTESPRSATVGRFSHKKIPYPLWDWDGEVIYVMVAERRGPWHDPAPRSWLGVPLPPGPWRRWRRAGGLAGGGWRRGGRSCFSGWPAPVLLAAAYHKNQVKTGKSNSNTKLYYFQLLPKTAVTLDFTGFQALS